MTADHYPHLNQVSPNVLAAMGYNGRGVVMASVMGKVLAAWAFVLRAARSTKYSLLCGTFQPIADIPRMSANPIWQPQRMVGW